MPQRPAKKLRIPGPAAASEDLGTYIDRDVNLLNRLGWTEFVEHRRPRSDLHPNVKDLPHPASRLLHRYQQHGVPIRFHTPPWNQSQIDRALDRGPHRSCHEHIDFLEEEFIDMINKGYWVVLPYSQCKDLPGLRLSPPGVVPQRNRRPRWIVDYSWWGVNDETIKSFAPLAAMQFGKALDRILRHILLANPANGPLYLLKLDLSDGFYRINLSPHDIPKLGVVFPTLPGEEPRIALPLVLPMGWTSSPPCFSAATETAADITNGHLQHLPYVLPRPHPFDTLAATMDIVAPSSPSNTNSSSATSPSPSLPSATLLPSRRDPFLPSSPRPTAYVDVFVDDFIAICQGETQKSHVRRHLLHTVDNVFRPNDFYDNAFRKDPVSLKKLRKGDVSWNTVKDVLGWVIDTTSLTIHLPDHRIQRLGKILDSVPATQKRLSVKKWHQILGELRSMALALPGSRNMFGHMQDALRSATKGRLTLRKGVHSALNDFRWMLNDITNRPTRIAEVVPLSASALGFHDASGIGAGGVWFPDPSLDSRMPGNTSTGTPILWRYQWPDHIQRLLVSDDNPHGTITNSDLELAGGLLHLEAIAQHYDVRERTILSKTDNLATLFWQRKGSATTTKAPSSILRLFGIHQRHHRYVPRHDYIAGPSNPIADDASRLFHLSNSQLVHRFNTSYPQKHSYKIVTLPSAMVSSVITALLTKTLPVESLLVDPPAPTLIGQRGHVTPLRWASNPFSKPSKTRYQCYKSSSDKFVKADLQPTVIQSSLDRLKITYGRLAKRSVHWASPTLV